MAETVTMPLNEVHVSSGAEMGEYRGCSMPLHYGDVDKEYRAVRSGAGIADRSFPAKLEFTGNDVHDYLQRMTSFDLSEVAPGQGCRNTLLTDRGKLIADFRQYRLEDRERVCLDPLRKGPFLEPIEKFIIMDDVKITDITDDFGIVGVYGPNSGALLSAVFRLDMPPLEEYRHFEAFYAGEDLLVTCSRITGGDGFEIWVPVELMAPLWEDLTETGRDHAAVPVGLNAFEIARIEAGVPAFGSELDEETIPPEAGLGPLCSVTKGCYVGQEIISRIHHRGHVNRQLAGLKIAGDPLPAPGDEVREGERKVGKVTSAAFSPGLNCGIALAILRKEAAETGKKLSLYSGGGETEAEVTELPFIP